MWVAILVAPAARSLRADEGSGLAVALEAITAVDLQRHVDRLADETLEGREAGSRGGRRAAAYVAKVLANHGAVGHLPGGSYYQRFASAYHNVLAHLPGSDPELAKEWLIISAHYDHVGYGTHRNSYGPIGHVHNGADDNASGTSVVLELADAFAQLTPAPRRSILFALWDAEEKGLLGSRFWVTHPSVPLRQVRAAVCLDMVGRLRKERLWIFGTRTGWGQRRRLSEANRATGLQLEFSWKLRANSDHWPLIERRIPTLLLHTGLHDHYHRPSDDANLINRQGMHAVTRLLFEYVLAMAQADVLPGYRDEGRRETPASRRWEERLLPPPPGRLGLAWSREAPPEGGVIVTRVVTESAAATAGLQPGDRIVAVDGEPLRQGDQLQAAVLAAAAELELRVARSADDPPHPALFDVRVTLRGDPVRVGISWRQDHAQPGAVLVTRVVAGSPADRAGLRTGDRIYQIASQDFATPQEFADRLRSTSGPVTLLAERRGRLRTTTLDLPPLP
jgi:hypothetical protein